ATKKPSWRCRTSPPPTCTWAPSASRTGASARTWCSRAMTAIPGAPEGGKGHHSRHPGLEHHACEPKGRNDRRYDGALDPANLSIDLQEEWKRTGEGTVLSRPEIWNYGWILPFGQDDRFHSTVAPREVGAWETQNGRIELYHLG